jgi:uncharacterized protein (DUF1499 family)
MLGLSAALLLVLLVLAVISRRPVAVGLAGGHLRPCPEKPNCVNSQEKGNGASIRPLAFDGESTAAWRIARRMIEDMGGTVRTDEGHYLWATFSSRVFGFVDDLELHLDRNKRLIHLRSAARVGYSDLGVNRKRADELRAGFQRRMDLEASD